MAIVAKPHTEVSPEAQTPHTPVMVNTSEAISLVVDTNTSAVSKKACNLANLWGIRRRNPPKAELLFAAGARGDILHTFEGFDLLCDLVFEDVAGDVHQRIAVIGVNAHAR